MLFNVDRISSTSANKIRQFCTTLPNILFGGMTIQDLNNGGIDPNSHHPDPRPSISRDFYRTQVDLVRSMCLVSVTK